MSVPMTPERLAEIRSSVERTSEWSAFLSEIDRRDLLAEVDRLRAQVSALTSALERTEANFRAAVRGLPVRDMAENLAENRAAMASGGDS